MNRNEELRSKSQPWMVTLPTAVKISGIPVGRLRQLVKDKEISSYQYQNGPYYIFVDELYEYLRRYSPAKEQ